MASGHVQRLRLRLFLEGVEVPIIAANVKSAPNGPAVASIQIPPLAEATRFLPRTLVHLYFWDMYTASSPFIDQHAQQAPVDVDPTNAEKENSDANVAGLTGNDGENFTQADAKSRNYKLLFVGEIVGFQWTKNALNRSVVLQCLDLSNYWDYAYQTSNTSVFGPSSKAIFSGSSSNLFTDELSSKGSVITAIVSSGSCNTFPKLKGLAAGIVRLMEAVGGTYFPRPGSKAKKVRGQNLFFSMAELRLHITQMVGAIESDPTTSQLLQRGGYTAMFDRALGGLGDQTSIRQAINALTQIVFHEMYPQPCPLYVPGGNGEVSGQKRSSVRGHPQWGFIESDAAAAIEGLTVVLNKFETLEGEVSPGISREALFGPPSRGELLSLVTSLNNLKKSLLKTVVRLRATGGSEPPTQARAIFTKAAQLVGVASTQTNSWRPKAPVSTRRRPLINIIHARVELKKALDLLVYDVAEKSIEPARLLQQIFRPDIWFGAPPRCNVLFPEAYNTLQYQRMFLQEPTRFLLKTNDEEMGEDEFFDRYYFAPQAGSVKEDKTRLQDMLAGALLDHELFTGILPIFEKMGEFNIFANRSGTTQSTGGVAKAGPAQRSANFLYFKHRFNARKMRVSGKFNPWVAPGFPGLIIDKYVDVETVKLHNKLRLQSKELGLTEQEVGAVLGTNFLGNFTEVSHSVSQEAAIGMTEITCSYPRQPEEGVEFLGAAVSQMKLQRKEDASAVRTTDIAAVSSPRVFGFGPNYGRITNVHDVTSLYIGAAADTGVKTGGKQLPLFDVQVSPKRRNDPPALVSVGVTLTAFQHGPEAVEITGDPDRLVSFRAYRVTEDVPRYRQEGSTVPIEEFIRPGWYGELWTTAKIGQVYNDFFATGSITDAQTIVSPSGAGAGSTSEERQQAVEDQQEAEDAEDPRGDAPAALALDEGATIQQAVEFLWVTYSYIKQQGLDVEEFIRAYTWRPVATMLDMFGTSDLKFAEDGSRVLSGIEGFHSKAFGNYDDLFGLVGPDVEDILGISRGAVAAQRADTRKRKLQKVQEYVSALRFSRALLG